MGVDPCLNDAMQNGHGPLPVGKEIVVSNPQPTQEPGKAAGFKKGKGLTDIFYHVFYRPGPDLPPKMAHQGTIIALVGASPGSVYLGPNRIVMDTVMIPVNQVPVCYAVNITGRLALPGYHQPPALPVCHSRHRNRPSLL